MRKYFPTGLLLLLIATVTTFAQKLPEVYSTEAGAIQGYDPVAFFKEGKPVMGQKEFNYTWNDATWYFSKQENLDLFKADPIAYAPQYGGYCAYGTASGHKASTQPETWTIVNNKLYFNYNTNVQKLWNKNQKGLIDQADKNWPKVKKE
jgi:YHS domain-containing protein